MSYMDQEDMPNIKEEARKLENIPVGLHQNVCIKQKPVDVDEEVNVKVELDLYADHEIKDELVVGPVELRPRDSQARMSRALCVTETPGGSFRVTGDIIDVRNTPGGHVRCEAESSQPPDIDVLERVEAMDMSEEEVDDLIESAPWHVQRWMRDLAMNQGRECRTPIPLIPSKSTEVNLDNLPGNVSVLEPNISQSEPRVTSVDADCRPSTSGVTATSKPFIGVNRGSDLDSDDFDDEYDIEPGQVESEGLRRGIPDNEDLNEPVLDMVDSVQRAMDDEVDRMLGVSSNFEWQEDFETFRGVPEVFSGPTPGPLKDYDEPHDAFLDIWSRDIMELIAVESNRYAKQTIDFQKRTGRLKPHSRLNQWSETDADEITVLFAVFMYMAIDPRTSQNEYWMANDFLEMPRFRELMSYNRFVLLCKFLHFVDNSAETQDSPQNAGVALSPKLVKLVPVIAHLNSKFSSLYHLEKEISIDESLTLFKGCLSWVQTIRSKAARFGIKSYELCESRTGYLYNFFIYTGKNNDTALAAVPPCADLGRKSTKVVLDLLKGLEARGHSVTMDNFYNSPSLARYLKALGFDCLGTLRTNRKNVPVSISKLSKNVAKGTIIARQCGDVSIIAWKDSKLVTMISTHHNDETYHGTKAGKPFVKPVCVRDYNNTMGGVDLKDQKLSMYLLERKRGVKWYVKIFKRLLNVSIHNAFVMYVKSLKRRNMLTLTHREFRYGLAKSLVEQHHRKPPEIREQIGELSRLRRDVVHEPRYDTGRNSRKRCVVCLWQNVEKKVHSQCVTCGVFLCFENCFREWHSLPKLKGQERGRRKRIASD